MARLAQQLGLNIAAHSLYEKILSTSKNEEINVRARFNLS
jgi:hypothetical protein